MCVVLCTDVVLKAEAEAAEAEAPEIDTGARCVVCDCRVLDLELVRCM